MAYDEGRGVVVLFGGRRDTELFNDTWEWDGKNWKQMNPPHVPPARCCHALAYDSVQHKVLLYGGWNANENLFYSDTWEWDGKDWSKLDSGNAPLAAGHSIVDAEADGLVVAVPSTPNAFTWEWDGHAWSQVRVEPSPSRSDGTSVYDPQTRQVVLFGGITNGRALNDLWVYDGTRWSLLALGSAPPARYGQSMFYDMKRQSIVVFGGGGQSALLNDMWEIKLPKNLSGLLALATPTPIPTQNPNPSAMLIP